MDDNRFWVHDTTICIRSVIENDKVLFGKIKRAMKRLGFSFGSDQRVAPVLRKRQFYGSLQELECDTGFWPAMIELEFYQNINFENPYGGRYDFRRLAKMPYLVRLRFQKTLTKLKSLFLKYGLRDDSDYHAATAYEEVMRLRKKTEEWHPRIYKEQPRYNDGIDADGNRLNDGEIRYYYDYHGRLYCGKVYYHINNMWYVVCNDSRFSNMACWELFAWKPGLARKRCRDPQSRIQSLLNKAVENQNFEKAIILRDLLKRSVA